MRVLMPPWHAHSRLLRRWFRVREDVEPAAYALEGTDQQEGLVPLQAPSNGFVGNETPHLEDEAGKLPPVYLQRVACWHQAVQLLRSRVGVKWNLSSVCFFADHLTPVIVNTVHQSLAALHHDGCKIVIGLREDGVP
eukprot:CAMPEP_0172782762 /NCGR_PEP_ID=MMETSP1074-20121228/204093_1 /TAXON_ID=2916 /ORGANISM="Ceratium fusus, Strain PA161109" /LENGTH=136 /DNA_ID=CAMNT_0013619745 /DNA_START=450 /DNA_END=860 /DNA_ORIENTATION=+